jgi:hypothetical protein
MNDIDIFSEALALAPPEERRKFLGEACGDDRGLRNHTEALLRSSTRLSGRRACGEYFHRRRRAVKHGQVKSSERVAPVEFRRE